MKHATSYVGEETLEECDCCDGTSITQADDGDGYMDDVECSRCINGWVDTEGRRPEAGPLARAAWAEHNPKVPDEL